MKTRTEYPKPVSIVIKTCFDPKEMETTLELIKYQLSNKIKWYEEETDQKFQILLGRKYLKPMNNSNEKREIEIHITQNTREGDTVYFNDDADLTGYICNAAVYAIESTMPLEKPAIISAVKWHLVEESIKPSIVYKGYV